MYNKIFVFKKVGGQNVQKSVDLIDTMKYMKDRFYEDQDLTIIESMDDIDENTVCVPCGGDGTVLFAAKTLANAGYDIPIIGFNLGQVGFLTDMAPEAMFVNALYDTMLNIPSRYNMGPFKEDHRTMLAVTDDHGHDFLALNDFVISNLYSDNIIKYDLSVGESFAGTHKANGVIISTPTGSTAYAMNVGGSIIEPDLDVIEICPIAGMGLSCRPMIVSANNHIEVSIKGRPGHIISFKADGIECQRIEGKDVDIRIVRHEKKVRLLHMSDWNYFERLSEKLNWNT